MSRPNSVLHDEKSVLKYGMENTYTLAGYRTKNPLDSPTRRKGMNGSVLTSRNSNVVLRPKTGFWVVKN